LDVPTPTNPEQVTANTFTDEGIITGRVVASNSRTVTVEFSGYRVCKFFRKSGWQTSPITNNRGVRRASQPWRLVSE